MGTPTKIHQSQSYIVKDLKSNASSLRPFGGSTLIPTVSQATIVNHRFKWKDDLMKAFDRHQIPDYHISLFFDSTRGLELDDFQVVANKEIQELDQ